MNITPDRLRQSLLELVEAFHAAGLPFAIAGAFAVAIHGHERATRDIDALLRLADQEAADRVLRALGYTCTQHLPGIARYQRQPVAELPELVEYCDLLFSSGRLGQRSITSANRQPLRWHGRDVPVVPVDVLILMKLMAHLDKPDRPNDWADARALVRLHQSALDLMAMRSEAATLDPALPALLDRLLDDPTVADTGAGYGNWHERF